MTTLPKARKGDALTEAERKVVALLAEDKMLKQIAHDLGISVVTAQSHTQSAKRKIGATTHVGIALWWVRGGKDEPAAPKYIGTPPRRSPKVVPSMADYCAARGIA